MEGKKNETGVKRDPEIARDASKKSCVREKGRFIGGEIDHLKGSEAPDQGARNNSNGAQEFQRGIARVLGQKTFSVVLARKGAKRKEQKGVWEERG